MAGLVKKGFIPDPHVLFGAIGDATCDTVPLQVGQFEGGNEMDEALSNIFLEQGGGGHKTESYELAMYFMARHTDIHCVTQRGQKAYLFLLGDETPYPAVKKNEVKTFIGDTIQADIPTEDILNELREKFEVFWILPASTSNFENEHVNATLQKMFGQNLLRLKNPEDVCELVVSTIGVTEGYDLHDVASVLKDIGSDSGAVTRASSALTAYSATRSVGKVTKTGGDLAISGKDSVERL